MVNVIRSRMYYPNSVILLQMHDVRLQTYRVQSKKRNRMLETNKKIFKLSINDRNNNRSIDYS